MSHHSHPPGRPSAEKRPVVFSKIFRWQVENPQPVSVAVAGTFNGWQKTPLKFDRANKIWQLALHDIPGHVTHHYMLLVNGKPANDPHADGLAVPHSAEEKNFAFATPRGPRVFVLFSHTK